MQRRDHDEHEERIRALFLASQLDEVATEALRAYGPKMLGFALAMTGDENAACEVFGQFCEDFWRGLPEFQWRSSLLTWMYAILRRACYCYFRDPWERRAEGLATPMLAALEQQIRTDTLPFLRSEVRSRFALLRAELEPEDRMLLVLRVDRRLTYREVALVMLDDDDPPESELKRLSASLRKRFERIKRYLAERAREEGLLADE